MFHDGEKIKGARLPWRDDEARRSPSLPFPRTNSHYATTRTLKLVPSAPMSPISRYSVRMTRNIRDPDVLDMSLNLIEAATQQPDLARFTVATLLNSSHTSGSDRRPHVTALLATDAQVQAGRRHAIHIYHDGCGNYTGHKLFPERKNRADES
ncbi:hypothetical protein F4823DRAFT_605340 [Ustulina deusta]|nr:hypothetical protein F4823DRAFT_605340 [Ustulina deusta]